MCCHQQLTLKNPNHENHKYRYHPHKHVGANPVEFMGLEPAMELASRRGAGSLSGAAGTLYLG